MDTLHIGLIDGESLLALQGAGVTAPVRGAVLYEPPPANAETVEQLVDVSLEGTPEQIEGFLQTVQRELALAELAADTPGAACRYLGARVTAGGTLRSSKILRGWVELLAAGADQRAGGTTGARLHLARVNHWEAALTWLPLSNLGANRLTGGVTVYNHRDTLHDNLAWAAAADTLGDLPAPALLDFRGVDTDNTGTIYAGQSLNATGALLALEGEGGAAGAGVTGTVTASAAASGGYYHKLVWSGAYTGSVWKYALEPLEMAAYGGKAFLPVLRLSTVNNSSALWFSWRVTVNYGGVGQVAYDAPGRWLAVNRNHCPGAAVFLPPWPVAAGETPPGIGLELRLVTTESGTHTLDLDCLHLLPLEAWRVYKPVVGTFNTLGLTDDPYSGTLKAGAYAIQMHQAEGPGLMVQPGSANRYYFLMERSGGGFGVDTRATVKVGYRPRSRGL